MLTFIIPGQFGPTRRLLFCLTNLCLTLNDYTVIIVRIKISNEAAIICTSVHFVLP